jgi:hypothetical protein
MLFAVLILAFLLSYLSIRRYGKIFNPFTLEVYIIVLFLVVAQSLRIAFLPGAKNYIYSDLVLAAYLISVFFGTYVVIRIPKVAGLRNRVGVNVFNLLFYIALVLPLAYYFRNFEISFQGIRSFYENVVFSPYASLFEISKYLLYFIIILRLFRVRRFDFVTLGLSALLFLYGSKYAIFDLIVVFFVFFEQFKRLTIRRFIIWGGVAATLLVGYRFYQTKGESDVFKNAISYFDIYENQSMLIKKLQNGDHDYYYGEIYFSSFIKYIPRAIWHSKPRRFGFAILNWDLFPEYARNGYMPGFGLGPTFADFGFISIIVFGFFSGLLRNTLYNLLQKSKNEVSFLFFVFPLTFLTTCFVLLQILVDYILQVFKVTPGSDELEADSST